MKLFNSNLLIFFILFSSQLHADPKAMMYERSQNFQQQKQLLSTASEHIFKQILNHADPAHGTFDQRYFLDETFVVDKKNAPTFFYICGEGICTPRSLSGAIRTYAQQFHARLIALEHRFYGKSIPNHSFDNRNLQYLSTDAALRDLANFQKIISRKNKWHGKWISFGGSYPGSLSAYYREKYPNLVVGALASSGPVYAKEDFQSYDAHVAKVAGPHCTQLMQQVVSKIESQINQPTELNQTKALFEASHIEDFRDFLYLVADVGAAAVQYGMRNEFCSTLNHSETPLEGYSNFAKSLYQKWHVKPEQFVAQGATSTNPDDYPDGLGMRQWFYQSCREYGYWQNANQDPLLTTRSSLINLEYHRTICKRLYNLDVPANTDKMNKRFYEPLHQMKTSEIFFTNGSDDPWMTLSMAIENNNTDNPNLSYMTIANSAHCDDLRPPKPNDSTALKDARSKTIELISKWLNK